VFIRHIADFIPISTSRLLHKHPRDFTTHPIHCFDQASMAQHQQELNNCDEAGERIQVAVRLRPLAANESGPVAWQLTDEKVIQVISSRDQVGTKLVHACMYVISLTKEHPRDNFLDLLSADLWHYFSCDPSTT
jgi:hypothetical protein